MIPENKEKMEIKINVVEAAAKLSHEELKTMLLQEIPSEIGRYNLDEYLDSKLFDDEGNYTPEWQDEFNKLYDYYFEVISNCSVE